jgi:hypothetical protein
MAGQGDLNYRHEIVPQVFAILQAGDSCSIVGASGMGKSNLFRFVARVDVRQDYLGDAWSHFLFLPIDSHALPELSEQALGEALVARLIEAWQTQRGDDTAMASIATTHSKALAVGPGSRSTQVLAETVSSLLDRGPQWHIVVILDQFDEVYTDLPPRFFLNLRAIRDAHKQQVSFVTLTRQPLLRLSTDARRDEFYELLRPHIIGLGPYGHDDGWALLRRVGARYGAVPDEATAEYLFAVTGGHPGLLKAACMALALGQLHLAQSEPECLDTLLGNLDIRTECTRLIESLSTNESESLITVAVLGKCAMPQDVRHCLVLKGLLVEDADDAVHVFAPLLTEYIAAQAASTAAAIRVDPDAGRAWIGERPVEGLTHLEFDLLAYLYQRAGQVCSRDGIQEALYPHEKRILERTDLDGGDIDVGDAARVDAVVGRLRNKIEPNRSRPVYVITVHGRGYKLCRAETTEVSH